MPELLTQVGIALWVWVLISPVQEALPHMCWVLVVKLTLDLPPLSSLSLLDTLFQSVPLLFPVPHSECCVALPQQCLELFCHPRFPVWENPGAFLRGYASSAGLDVTENSGGIQ